MRREKNSQKRREHKRWRRQVDARLDGHDQRERERKLSQQRSRNGRLICYYYVCKKKNHTCPAIRIIPTCLFLSCHLFLLVLLYLACSFSYANPEFSQSWWFYVQMKRATMPLRKCAFQSTSWTKNRWPSWSNYWRIVKPQGKLRIIATVSCTCSTWQNTYCYRRTTWKGLFPNTSWVIRSARDSTHRSSFQSGTFTSQATYHLRKLYTSCGTAGNPAWSPWLCDDFRTFLTKQTFSGGNPPEIVLGEYIYITTFI